jgi:hypothetical protein
MTPGNGISGIHGDVLLGTTPISEIKKWSWNPKCIIKDYASNKTQGARKRVPGSKDGSGSIDGVWDPWNPICNLIDVGSIVTLTLQHTTGQTWTVPAIIENMKYDVDLDSGDIEGWSADYSICGMWTNPTSQPATTAGFLPFAATGAGSLPQEQSAPLFAPQTPYPNQAWGEAHPLQQPLAAPRTAQASAPPNLGRPPEQQAQPSQAVDRGPQAWQGQAFPSQPVAPPSQAANTSPFGQPPQPSQPREDSGLSPEQFQAVTQAVLAALKQQPPVR